MATECGPVLSIKHKLGTGAHATVLLAEGTWTAGTDQHRVLCTGPVALKLLHPTRCQSPSPEEATNRNLFLEEAAAMQAISSPYLITCHGTWTLPIGHQGVPKEYARQQPLGMLLEYMEMGSLARLVLKDMSRSGGLGYTDKEALALCMDIALGVLVMHSCKPPIIHRDLKQENVLLTRREGRLSAKIADLGLHARADGLTHDRMMRYKQGMGRTEDQVFYCTPELPPTASELLQAGPSRRSSFQDRPTVQQATMNWPSAPLVLPSHPTPTRPLPFSPFLQGLLIGNQSGNQLTSLAETHAVPENHCPAWHHVDSCASPAESHAQHRRCEEEAERLFGIPFPPQAPQVQVPVQVQVPIQVQVATFCPTPPINCPFAQQQQYMGIGGAASEPQRGLLAQLDENIEYDEDHPHPQQLHISGRLPAVYADKHWRNSSQPFPTSLEYTLGSASVQGPGNPASGLISSQSSTGGSISEPLVTFDSLTCPAVNSVQSPLLAVQSADMGAEDQLGFQALIITGGGQARPKLLPPTQAAEVYRASSLKTKGSRPISLVGDRLPLAPCPGHTSGRGGGREGDNGAMPELQCPSPCGRQVTFQAESLGQTARQADPAAQWSSSAGVSSGPGAGSQQPQQPAHWEDASQGLPGLWTPTHHLTQLTSHNISSVRGGGSVGGSLARVSQGSSTTSRLKRSLSQQLGKLLQASRRFMLSKHWTYVYNLTGETGSCMYMAPEIFRHEHYNESVDIYSLGVLFYEVLSHTMLAFTQVGPGRAADSAEEYARCASQGFRPERPRRAVFSDELWSLIEHMWAADPLDRPTSTEVITRLSAAIAAWTQDSPSANGSGCGCSVQ